MTKGAKNKAFNSVLPLSSLGFRQSIQNTHDLGTGQIRKYRMATLLNEFEKVAARPKWRHRYGLWGPRLHLLLAIDRAGNGAMGALGALVAGCIRVPGLLRRKCQGAQTEYSKSESCD
jgi:hypothetical protein